MTLEERQAAQEPAGATGMGNRDLSPVMFGNAQIHETQFRSQSAAYFTQSALNRIVQSRPDIGPALERMIQQHPGVTKETAAGLAYSGYYGAESPILDRIMQEQDAALAAANDNSWKARLAGKAKTGSRYSMVIMEDVWNNAPLMHWSRMGINMYQGQSFQEAFDTSTHSSAGNHIMLNRLGFDADYGEGWIPSTELIPDKSGLYSSVKQMILDGTFEGSAEERAIAAEQHALAQAMTESGMSPYAMSIEGWESTHISKTRGGVLSTVPWSPGAVAIHVTTPGTRAYNNLSGFIDAMARMTMEPTDLVLDNLGDIAMAGAFMRSTTKVSRDIMRFVGDGSQAMAEVLAPMGITYNVRGIPIPNGATTPSGNVAYDWATGTTKNAYEDGVRAIELDPYESQKRWEYRLEEETARQKGKALDEWQDPTSPYAKPYADLGVKPSEVYRKLQIEGGEQAEMLLTIEHELVHSELQGNYFETVATQQDGVRVADYAQAKKNAPEEVRRLSDELKEQKLDQQYVDELTNERGEIKRLGEEASADHQQLVAELKAGVTDDARRAFLNDELKALGEYSETLHGRLTDVELRMNSLMENRRIIQKQMSDVLEYEAVQKAWSNINDGSWAAKDVYKAYKKANGLSNILRPFVRRMAVSEFLVSGAGQRGLRRLARMKTIEEVRKAVPYLKAGDVALVAGMTDTVQIGRIIRDAHNSPNVPGLTTVATPGVVKDWATRGLDAFEATTNFNGGRIAQAGRFMGKQSRRMRAGTGNNILSVTDNPQTLDTIYSVGATLRVDPAEISRLQAYAIKYGNTKSGIDKIAKKLEEMSIRAMKDKFGDFYAPDQLQKMWDDWYGYETTNAVYWMSNAGQARNWLWDNPKRKFVLSDGMQQADQTAEAFMEAQFSATHRVVPDIRTFRRLSSRNRRRFERARRFVNDTELRKIFSDTDPGDWMPLGFEAHDMMKAADFSFGIWRDLQLMRLGWTLRILPEEQLRFAGSGFSSMFTNPLDYFITLFNRMDFELLGDDITLQEMMQVREGLGTGQLRDWRVPLHYNQGRDWRVVSRINEPRPYWAGMSQEFVEMHHDELLGRLARGGREAIDEFLKTAEGKLVASRIAKEAKRGSSLKRVKEADQMATYLDMAELRIAQITGGQGIWKDPTSGNWLDLQDRHIRPVSEMTRNELLEEIRLEFGEDAVTGYSGKNLGTLQARLDSLRGYEIDELNRTKRAAFVTEGGNEELVGLLGTGKLDDIAISKDMPIGAVRRLDGQLEEAYSTRAATPPEHWSFPEGVLDGESPHMTKRASDTFFRLFNAVPSKKLNRSPYFQQNFGRKVAEAYFYGNSDLRHALDEMIDSESGFRNAFDVGARMVLKEHDLKRFPKAWNGAPERMPLEQRRQMASDSYTDAFEHGDYDRVPLVNDPDGFVTKSLIDALNQIEVHESVPAKKRGVYTQRNNRAETDYTGFPELVFTGTGKRKGRAPLEEVIFQAQMRERDTLNGLLGLDTDAQLWDTKKAWRALDEDAQDFIGEYFGFRKYMQTGGITGDPSRATGFYSDPGQYGDYVDVFRRDHLEPSIEEHFVKEGDVEQLFVINEERFPALAAMDEDFSAVYNTVRNRTRWKQNASTRAELTKYPEEKAFYGMQEQFQVFDDEITWGDMDDAVQHFVDTGEVVPLNEFSEFASPQPLIPQYMITENPANINPYNNDLKGAIRRLRVHQNVTKYFDANPDDFYEFWEGYMIAYQVQARAKRSSQLPSVTDENVYRPPRYKTWREVPEDQRSIIVGNIMSSNPDPMDLKSASLTSSQSQILFEKELGRPLEPGHTDRVGNYVQGEADEFDTIWSQRHYAPEETITATQNVEPAARLPRQAVDQLTGMGIGIEHQRQLGDVALLLDQLEPGGLEDTTKLPLTEGPAGDLRKTIHGTNGVGWNEDPVKFMEAWYRAIDADSYEMTQTAGRLNNEILSSKTKDQLDPGSVPPPDTTLFETVKTSEGWHWRTKKDVARILVSDEGPLIGRMSENAAVVQGDLNTLHKDVRTMNSKKLRQKYQTENIDDIIRKSGVLADAMDEYNYQQLVLHMLDDPMPSANKGNLIKPDGVVGYNAEGTFNYNRNTMNKSWFDHEDPPLEVLESVIQNIDDNIDAFVRKGERVMEVKKADAQYGGVDPQRSAQEGFNLGGYGVPEEPMTLKTDFSDVAQDDRNAAVARMFPGMGNSSQDFDFPETGGVSGLPKSDPSSVESLELILQAAKFGAIEDTKKLFYDLSNKSNVADSLKFIFPFGDAWWEVLSRWGTLMNPARSGGQSLRNARRLQVTTNAAQQSGFISTNEYGEEVFNVYGFGSLANNFIPNSANINLAGKMNINSLMFIDPTARGVGLPGVSPAVQVTNMLTAPAVDAIPIFKDQMKFAASGLDWLTHGGKDKYRPGDPDELTDVTSMLTPTAFDRFFAMVFDQQHRDTYGNTKFRLFQSLGSLGNPEFNMSTPEGARNAWGIADTAGTWLGFLRIFDAWTMPGQPQYQPEFTRSAPEVDEGTLQPEELFEWLSDAELELQQPVLSVLRASAEYRQARELFGDGEADLYMMERYGFVPSFLQSATQGLVQYPVSWGGVGWVDENEWLVQHSPFTFSATVPPDADDTFSSEAWNNLFSEFLEVDGIENQPVRVKRSPSEFFQSVQRGLGYDQLRHQQDSYDKAIEQLRAQYGDNYASQAGYRSAKLFMDQKLRDNKSVIQAQYPIVSGSAQGRIFGSRQGVTDQMYSDEIIDIGTPGTDANIAYRENVPVLADVAENYATMLTDLYQWSRLMERGTASPDWWKNGESDTAEAIRTAVAQTMTNYYQTINDPHAKAYAEWLNKNIMDPFMDDWEWINNRFAPQLARFPTAQFTDTIGVTP